jgi:hypothetical protein
VPAFPSYLGSNKIAYDANACEAPDLGVEAEPEHSAASLVIAMRIYRKWNSFATALTSAGKASFGGNKIGASARVLCSPDG